MTTAARPQVRPARDTAIACAVLAAITGVELAIARSWPASAARATALVACLLEKADLGAVFLLRASRRRMASRLVGAAIVLAVGFTVVLMLEAAYWGRSG
jgi:hypothetical protein